jgi:hypothetical protein
MYTCVLHLIQIFCAIPFQSLVNIYVVFVKNFISEYIEQQRNKH